PEPDPMPPSVPAAAIRMALTQERREPLARARRYLARVPPAMTGQHGDLHTFQVCCRLVRGFALSDAEAMTLLAEWNARCAPPWSERELQDKLQRARRCAGEPLGGMVIPAHSRPSESD